MTILPLSHTGKDPLACHPVNYCYLVFSRTILLLQVEMATAMISSMEEHTAHLLLEPWGTQLFHQKVLFLRPWFYLPRCFVVCGLKSCALLQFFFLFLDLVERAGTVIMHPGSGRGEI